MISAAIGAIVLQTALGVFFAASGFNKLFNIGRRAMLRETLEEDGVPFPKYMCWWVAGWELGAGIIASLSALWYFLGYGIIGQLAMVPMIAILLVACCAEALPKVRAYEPINKVDWVADWLYLPEVLMLVMAVSGVML